MIIIKRSRTNHIQVWLNDEELAQLNAKANSCGLKREAYLRKIIREEKPIERPSDDLIVVISELKAIGKNMNQIAMRANETNMIDALQYKKNYDMVHKAISKLIMGDYKWQ